MGMRGVRALGIGLGFISAACGPQVEGGGSSSGPETADDPSGPDDATTPGTIDDTGGDDPNGIQLVDQRAVDIMFVVDNSGTMGEEQGLLAAAIGVLVDDLDAAGIDYRVGVTTTDNGNPWCASTGPEAGKFVGTSCRQRTGEFVFSGNPPADATAIACTDRCTHEDLGIVPTATEYDPNPAPRPWIESSGGVANLADATVTEALACLLPQGIAGCGFEAHLESMYKALLRTEKAEETQYGFMRAGAVLAVVFMSDEADCSYSSDWDSIFLPATEGGNPDVFWEDPSASSPTSAVCWNAGVACTGGPGVYDECHAENYDVTGSAGATEDQAVLHPLSRYIDFVQEVEDFKREFTPGQEVLVHGITGVPVGYESGQADIVYADGQGTEQIDFGIGAGCVNNAVVPPGVARPPVREREFAEAFEVGGQRNLHSICADDFSPALAAIGASIRDQIRPTCMPACVADTNPVTQEVDPQCVIVQESPNPGGGGITETDVPPCEGGSPPGGSDVCYEPLVGDAMSPFCIEEGWNLEFRIVRTVPAPGGTTLRATCQLSVSKEVDCPDL
jgi:hypothetical protein